MDSATVGPTMADGAGNLRPLRELSDACPELVERATLARAGDALGLLGEDWEPERDIVTVVLGAGGMSEASAFAQTLRARGQGRVLLLDPCSAPLDDLIRTWCRAVRELPCPWPTRHIGYRMLGGPDLLETLNSAFRDVVRDHTLEAMTFRVFGHTWLKQSLQNLLTIASCATVLDVPTEPLRARPAVIISPGPSLEKNGHLLRQFKGKALLLCCAQAVPACLHLGVRPDVVLVSDAQSHATFLGDAFSDLPHVLASQVHPLHFAQAGDRCILTYAANDPVGRWCYPGRGGQVPELVTGGNVSTTGIGLAAQWQCDPIVFVGLDLAFTRDRIYAYREDVAVRQEAGLVRAEGWRPDELAAINLDDLRKPATAVELPGYYGEPVLSDVYFQFIWRWVEMATRWWPDTRFINATEGGVRLIGTDHLPLERVAAAFVAGRRVCDFEQLLTVRPSPEQQRERRRCARAQCVQAVKALEEFAALLEGPAYDLVRIADALPAVEFATTLLHHELAYADSRARLPLLRQCAEQAHALFIAHREDWDVE